MTRTATGRETSLLVCAQCASEYSVDTARWRCACGEPLDLAPWPSFDGKALQGRPFGPWRYRESLPAFADDDIVTLGEGLTPLVGRRGSDGVKYKLDFMMPTGSFKDRGTTVLISELKRLHASRVVEDSSGNAGASVAAYCAAAGIACDIYVPAHTSPNKTRQIRTYGATLVAVEGGRDRVAAAAEAAVGPGTSYASHTWSPFFLAGTATVAYEIWEQLGARVPDSLIVPAGAGTLLLGAYLGFAALIAARLSDRMPRLFAVQAASCAPLESAWRRGSASIEPTDGIAGNTIAEGIRIQSPVRGRQVLKAVRDSRGAVVAVQEQQIRSAWDGLSHAGLFVEPTSAVVAAAADVLIASGDLGRRDLTVAVLTGSGLKSVDRLEPEAR